MAKYNGKEERNEPLIIRNGNGEEFEIRAVVWIEGRNYCSIVKKAAATNDIFTDVETHLPYNDHIIDFSDIKHVLNIENIFIFLFFMIRLAKK
jgi:hypothetical protein